MALHNFIRDSKMIDKLFDKCDEDEEYVCIPSCCQASGLGDEEGAMNNFGHQFANALFLRRMYFILRYFDVDKLPMHYLCMKYLSLILIPIEQFLLIAKLLQCHKRMKKDK
jgi:hypothetical protein